MTGLRGLRQEIKAIRDELGGSQRCERFTTMQSGANTTKPLSTPFWIVNWGAPVTAA
jgi:hypothetical protein